MHFQTLLPAILFAQSSFAYYCCFQLYYTQLQTIVQSLLTIIYSKGQGGLNDIALFHRSGGLELWTTVDDCKILISKGGANCAAWKWRKVGSTCSNLEPMAYLGVAPSDHCYSK